MAWMEIAGTVLTARDIYRAISEESGYVKKSAKRLRYRYQNGKMVLPIFGAGGTGKSTLGRALIASNPLELTQPYKEDRKVTTLKLEGDVPGKILVAPGQSKRVSSNWPALIRAINEGKCSGFINVVSYGLHATELPSFKQLESFGTTGNWDDDLEEHFNFRRGREISLLEYIFSSTETAKRPFWMITLVVKQDLWADKSAEVKSHYLDGEYNQWIEKFFQRNGTKGFAHEFVNTSLAIENLATEKDGVVLKTASGYDMATHLASLRNLHLTVDQFVGEGRLDG